MREEAYRYKQGARHPFSPATPPSGRPNPRPRSKHPSLLRLGVPVLRGGIPYPNCARPLFVPSEQQENKHKRKRKQYNYTYDSRRKDPPPRPSSLHHTLRHRLVRIWKRGKKRRRRSNFLSRRRALRLHSSLNSTRRPSVISPNLSELIPALSAVSSKGHCINLTNKAPVSPSLNNTSRDQTATYCERPTLFPPCITGIAFRQQKPGK
ncbi:hypothetical protein LZ30DRAFT_132147 [Colletotrichum cereale]|nr:hypothetical protein LZ30DRAFT_132147 [Colletotrichum cereale]